MESGIDFVVYNHSAAGSSDQRIKSFSKAGNVSYREAVI